MAPKDKTQKNDGGKRKAWVYEETQRTRLIDVLKGSDNRWRGVLDILRDVVELSLFYGLKLLPASAVSAIGGFLGRTVLPRWKGAVNRVTTNLRLIRPDASEAQIAAWVAECGDSIGRLKTEYSVLHRLVGEQAHVRFVGTETIVETCKGQPVIFIAMHVSNFEILWRSLLDLGLDLFGSYDPPKRALHHWIVRNWRKHERGLLLPAGMDAVRPALKTLKDNSNLIVFCDEGFQGKVRGPLFGRPPHLQGNYAFVARLARKTNALLYPVYVTRDHGIHFTFHALAPFRLPPEETPGSRLTEDVKLINSVVEPVIAAHPGQWYFLTDKIVPL